MAHDPRHLVDAERGLLDRRVFSDPDLYQQELDQIFARCWLFLGHESQLRRPGDFLTTYMGADPVILCRDGDGRLAAFLNTCRHRGNRVCRFEEGNTSHFTCSYHGWTYTNAGKLVGVPAHKEYYFQELDKEQWGLVPVAQLDTYKGLIFGTFGEDVPSLRDYLGEMAWYLDLLVDRREGGTELIGGAHKWVVGTNWKLPAENFVGDMYHSSITHASAFRVGFGGGSAGTKYVTDVNGFQVSLPGGHGVGVRWIEGGDATVGNPLPELTAYAEEILPELEARLGSVRARMLSPVHGTVFPNFSFLNGTHTIRVWHPKGPGRTEVTSWCIVDARAAPAVKDAWRLHYLRRFSPAGTWEQDDGDNWIQATESSSGAMSRRVLLNYQMGLHHERRHPDLPGLIGDFNSDVNQRNFYRQWAAYMGADRPREGG